MLVSLSLIDNVHCVALDFPVVVDWGEVGESWILVFKKNFFVEFILQNSHLFGILFRRICQFLVFSCKIVIFVLQLLVFGH